MHCDFTPHIELYKVIDDTNDSFEQFQQFDLPLRSCAIHQFKLIGCADGLFCLLEKRSLCTVEPPSIRKSFTHPERIFFFQLTLNL